MSLPAQKSTIEPQPLIAVRNVRASSRWYVELLGAELEFQNTPIATCTIGSRTSDGCFFNCMRGTPKSTPISSTQMQRLPGTVSCCGFRSMI